MLHSRSTFDVILSPVCFTVWCLLRPQDITTNLGNRLLTRLLGHRYPHVFDDETRDIVDEYLNAGEQPKQGKDQRLMASVLHVLKGKFQWSLKNSRIFPITFAFIFFWSAVSILIVVSLFDSWDHAISQWGYGMVQGCITRAHSREWSSFSLWHWSELLLVVSHKHDHFVLANRHGIQLRKEVTAGFVFGET